MGRDSIDTAFTALSRRMAQNIAMPASSFRSSESLANLIDKVNAAKRAYEPRVR